MTVRLAKTEIRGVTAWVEADRPNACERCGGRALGATWAQCPDAACRKMCRQWPCLADGCGWRKVNPEHVCETAAPGVHRGG